MIQICNFLLILILMQFFFAADLNSLGHIDANAPKEDSFDAVLQRDLNSYFSPSVKGKISVEYELLRKIPTQVGVALPKYYAWVRIFDDQKLLKEGAVRLAAEEQNHFDVTDYVDKSRILSDPACIDSIFPAALCPLIREKAKK